MTRAFFRMIRGWINGTYTAPPWRSLAWGAVLFVYLFSPIDLIPDYIPFFGVVDDMVLLGFFLRSLNREVARFVEWEQGRSAP